MAKKPTKQKQSSSNELIISLLKEIRGELALERKNKVRNALILATAVVMFAVPLNFAVEISANYIDSNTDAPDTFDDFSSYYFWLFCFCMGAVLVALSKFYLPISRIFMHNFDWETAFEDIEKEGKDDDYNINPDEVYVCDICLKEFPSIRSYKIHEEDCRKKNPAKWEKWDNNLQEELDE